MSKTLLISLSGGRTSAFMTHAILNGDLREEYSKRYDEIIPVFMNTSCEHQETYRFLQECCRAYGWNPVILEAVPCEIDRAKNTFQVTTLEECDKSGALFNRVAKQYGGFSYLRTCTREMKLRPFDKWRKKHHPDADIAIGIREDEPLRYKPRDGVVFPLVEDLPTDKTDVLCFWSKQAFDLRIPEYLGNCVFCFCKSNSKLFAAIKDMRESTLFDAALRHDEIRLAYQEGKRAASFRKYLMFSDLVKMSNEVQPDTTRDLFADEMSDGCTSSCEFFDMEQA